MARKYHFARGQQKQLEGDEGTARIYGKASRGLGKPFADKQKEIFEKFHDCWDEYISLAEAAIFEYAFLLGARLAMEVQSDTNE